MGGVLSWNVKAAEQQTATKEHEQREWERRLMLEQMIRERQDAVRIARHRELFLVYSLPASALYAFITAAEVARTRNRFFVLPLLPIVTGLLFYYDYCFGTQNLRLKGMAEEILRDSRQRSWVDLAGGFPTLQDVDKRLEALKQLPTDTEN